MMCSIFKAEDREKLNGLVARYKKTVPKLFEWTEEKTTEEFTSFNFPVFHRRRLRIPNGVERLNR